MSIQDSEARIKKAIAEISFIADRLPGIVLIHDVRDWSIAWMSDSGLVQLKTTILELQSLTSKAYYERFFNSEDSLDYPRQILRMMEGNNDEYSYTCFQQVRPTGEVAWTWHLASAKIFLRDAEDNPLLVIGIAFPVDGRNYVANKAMRVLEENTFLRKNMKRFASLSHREREILGMMALGKSSADTAEELFISRHTVETHRKNIKQKLETSSYFELCQYARSFDLI